MAIKKNGDSDGYLLSAGNLDLTFSNGFQSSITSGEQFTVLTAAAGVSGTFANAANGGRLGTDDGYGSFQVNYDSGAYADEILLSNFLPLSAAYWTGTLGSGGNGTWTTISAGASNFTIDPGGVTGGTNLVGSMTDVHLAATGGTNLTTTLGQNYSIAGLFIDSTATGAVTIAGAGNTLSIGADALTSASGAAAATISAPVVLANTQTWTINNASLTDSGGISDAGNTLGLTVAGTGTLVLSGSNTYTGGTTINAGASLLASGNSSLPNNQNVLNNGNLNIAATNAVGVVSGTGTLIVGSTTGAPATMGVTTLAQNSVTINNTGKLAMQTNASGTTNTIGSLTLTGNGTFDIANNIVNISEAITGKAIIQGYIQSGYASGNWNGPGINSSSAATNPGRGIGYADNADGTVAGLPANTVQVRYTLYGDTNLDGTVSVADVSNYAPNFNKPGSTFDWAQGDFNYDGTVSIADVSLAAPNFNKSLSASGLAVVAGSKSAGTLASAARPSVKFILSSNDNGQGVFTPGAFAVYAVDSTADGNSGLALYGVSLTGMSTITNLSPTSQTGSSVAGFYSFRSASDTAVPISGFQSAVGTGDTFTPIYSLGQDGQVLLATGTFSGSVAFNDVTTNDVADVFTDQSGDLGSQLNVGNGEIVLATQNLAPVPEPAAVGLLMIGAIGLLARRRRWAAAQKVARGEWSVE